MSNVNDGVLRAIETKLQNLVRCILNRAAVDQTFARELEEVLLTDSLAKKLRERKGKAPRPEVFQPVPYLHAHGKQKLQVALSEMTDDNLRAIVRAEKMRRGKDVKGIDRQTMIAEILRHTQQRLQQGSVFLK